MHSSCLLLLCLFAALPLSSALEKNDVGYLKWARKQFRTELFELFNNEKMAKHLKIIHDEFFACKLDANETIARLLDTLPTFYPDEEHKYRNLKILASMFAGIDALEIARKCPAKKI